MKRLFVMLWFVSMVTANSVPAAETAARLELTVDGTRFVVNGQPFPFTGVSFFNALYNPAFNRNNAARRTWLRKFRAYGVNVLRIWGQWDNSRGFVDAAPEATLYQLDGGLRAGPLATLKALLSDAEAEGDVIELCLFAQESWREHMRLEDAAAARAVEALTRELQPWRNVTFQVWNEHYDDQVLPLVKAIKMLDARRLVTSVPGYAGALGPRALNEALDYLTPHTSRQSQGRSWELAPREIAGLLAGFHKPVVDDEPARNGTPAFGGPGETIVPTDHILQIWEVGKVGGYSVYHHDMFQTGYGTSACPPNGIPDPEFSPYHRQVFEFLKLWPRYHPAAPVHPQPSSKP